MTRALSRFLLNSFEGNVMFKFSSNVLKSLITEEEERGGVKETAEEEEEEETRREGGARWGGGRERRKEEEKEVSVNKRIITEIKAKIFRAMGTLLSQRQILRKENEKKTPRKHSPEGEILNIYLIGKIIEQDSMKLSRVR